MRRNQAAVGNLVDSQSNDLSWSVALVDLPNSMTLTNPWFSSVKSTQSFLQMLFLLSICDLHQLFCFGAKSEKVMVEKRSDD
jgi:hypothetical protein